MKPFKLNNTVMEHGKCNATIKNLFDPYIYSPYAKTRTDHRELDSNYAQGTKGRIINRLTKSIFKASSQDRVAASKLKNETLQVPSFFTTFLPSKKKLPFFLILSHLVSSLLAKAQRHCASNNSTTCCPCP